MKIKFFLCDLFGHWWKDNGGGILLHGEELYCKRCYEHMSYINK